MLLQQSLQCDTLNAANNLKTAYRAHDSGSYGEPGNSVISSKTTATTMQQQVDVCKFSRTQFCALCQCRSCFLIEAKEAPSYSSGFFSTQETISIAHHYMKAVVNEKGPNSLTRHQLCFGITISTRACHHERAGLTVQLQPGAQHRISAPLLHLRLG